MRTPEDYASSLPAAADPPAIQKVFGPAPASVAPHPPPSRTSESGHPLEEFGARIERAERAIERAQIALGVVEELGWWKKSSPSYVIWRQRRKELWQARALRANAVWELDAVRNPVTKTRSSGICFALECVDNDDGSRSLHRLNRRARNRKCWYRKNIKKYGPGPWSAQPGHEFEDTSFNCAKAPWELELEAKETMETTMEQPVKPSASLSDPAASPSRNPSSFPSSPAPALPKRRRDEDDGDDNFRDASFQRPTSPKRVRFSPPLPKPVSSNVSACAPSSRLSSLPAVAPFPPPSPRPWEISGQKRCYDNNSDDEGASKPSKRIRPWEMPLPKRAGSAPPALAIGPILAAGTVPASPVLTASPSSSNRQVHAAASSAPSRQTPPPPSPSPSFSSSGSSSSSPSVPQPGMATGHSSTTAISHQKARPPSAKPPLPL